VFFHDIQVFFIRFLLSAFFYWLKAKYIISPMATPWVLILMFNKYALQCQFVHIALTGLLF